MNIISMHQMHLISGKRIRRLKQNNDTHITTQRGRKLKRVLLSSLQGDADDTGINRYRFTIK